MGLMDSLKNLVTEQVEVPDAPVIKAASLPPIISATSLSAYPISTSVSTSSTEIEAIDQSIKSKFQEALAINTPPLYTELNDTVAMLAEDIPNVASRYKAAIKILAKRGATTVQIVTAFDSCIQTVEKKAQEFQAAAAKKIEEKIGGRKNQIQTIESNITAINNQIQNLNAQIVGLQSQIATFNSNRDQLSSEIVKEESSIKLKQERLTAVYNQFHSDLDKQKQALLDYSK